MIEAKNVGKTYVVKQKNGLFSSHVKEVVAVRDVSFCLERGEIVGLLGLNGAGKSTTIRMLSTLLEPTSGSITMDGIDLVKQPQKVRGQINMIAGGERMLYWRLTGRENLLYFGQLYGLTKDVIVGRIKELLEWVGLTEAADIPVERYSKGMKQRLQIARGLINDPAYLFLDEPTLGLDAPIAREMRRLVKRLAKERNRGLILTSHYMAEVEELSDRIYLMHKGSIISEGTPEEMRSASQEQVLYQLEVLGPGGGLSKTLQDLAVEELSVTSSEAVCKISFKASPQLPQEQIFLAVGTHGGRVISFSATEPTLEDVVVALVGSEQR